MNRGIRLLLNKEFRAGINDLLNAIGDGYSDGKLTREEQSAVFKAFWRIVKAAK